MQNIKQQKITLDIPPSYWCTTSTFLILPSSCSTKEKIVIFFHYRRLPISVNALPNAH